MSSVGRLSEQDGQQPVMPSWFNSLFRQLKFLFRPGLVCAENSHLGRLTRTSATRITVTMPDANAGEFVFSAGQFMQEVAQPYVDFQQTDVPGGYAIYYDAQVNQNVACPRFEIWPRKAVIVDGVPQIDAKQYVVIGWAMWNGTAYQISPQSEALRLAALGILPTAESYRGPLAVRDDEQITLGDRIKAGPGAPLDPNAMVSPAYLQLVVGWFMRLVIGPNADWNFGRNGVFQFDSALLRLLADSVLHLINSTLKLAGTAVEMSGGSRIKFLDSYYPGEWMPNELTVEEVSKIHGVIAADGTIRAGRGIDHVNHVGGSGTYTIHFSRPFADTNYRIYYTRTGGENGIINWLSHIETDQIEINFDSGGQWAECDFVFEIFGRMTSAPIVLPPT